MKEVRLKEWRRGRTENGRKGIKEGMEKRKKESGDEIKVQNNGT